MTEADVREIQECKAIVNAILCSDQPRDWNEMMVLVWKLNKLSNAGLIKGPFQADRWTTLGGQLKTADINASYKSVMYIARQIKKEIYQ